MTKKVSVVIAAVLLLSLVSWCQKGMKTENELATSAEQQTKVKANGSLSVETGIVFQSGDVLPLARMSLRLSRKSFAEIVAEVLGKNNNPSSDEMEPIQKFAKGIALTQSLGESSGVLQDECITSLDKYSSSSAVTDFQGRAEMSLISPGIYFLVGHSYVRGTAFVWNVRVEIKPGNNSIVLDQNNAIIAQ